MWSLLLSFAELHYLRVVLSQFKLRRGRLSKDCGRGWARPSCARISPHRDVLIWRLSQSREMLLRRLNFSDRDIQQVKTQVLRLCPAVSTYTHSFEFFSSISCITLSCASNQSISDKPSPCPSKLSGLIRQRGSVLLKFLKPVLWYPNQACWRTCIFQLWWCCADCSIKCLK